MRKDVINEIVRKGGDKLITFLFVYVKIYLCSIKVML